MKFNFLKILNNQSNNPEEIAEQIVALEQKQIEYEKQRDLLRTQAKELRQRKLCGEAITDDQVKEADRKAENACLDLEAVAESILKLEEKLQKTYEAIVENGSAVFAQKINAITPEFDRLTEELSRAKAKVLIIAQQLWGYNAEVKLRRGQFFDDDPQADRIMKEEAEKLRVSVKEPTYFTKYTEAQNYSSWISALNISQESERLINKQRAKMGVAINEMV